MNAFVRQLVFIRTSRLLPSLLACAAIFVLVSGCAHLPIVARDSGAIGPATVTGQVTSERGAIIADAGVTLTGPAVRRSVRTDFTGRYTFERVPLGNYVVSASAAGYKGAKQPVNVDKEAAARVDFKLGM